MRDGNVGIASAALVDVEAPLEIVLGSTPPALLRDRSLLLALHFGTDFPAASQPAVVSPGLRPIDGKEHYESWWYHGEVRYREYGDIRIAECADYACIVVQREDVGRGQIRNHARRAYRNLLEAAATTGHRHLLKIWNYFSQINDGDGDSEKYRQFSVGRAEAFAAAGILDECVPTGTAVGCSDGAKFSTIALLSKHALRPAENPRQISAYRYPKQYGPRSPKFSRGGHVAADDHELFLISGTASIVGHESRHPYDTCRQIDETLENLVRLADAMPRSSATGPSLTIDSGCILHVHLRDPADFPKALSRLQGKLKNVSEYAVFLQSDICRRELMIEIDGVSVGR
jgi:chorismate lyase/3-hydroxybenzoate synthase